jgi:Zn-dependent protease
MVASQEKIRVRKIILFIIGGIAQIKSDPPSAASEFWIAIVGPLVSFVLTGCLPDCSLF